MLDWFFTTCGAYVDENGHALTGAALEAAKLDPKAPRCGHRMLRFWTKYCLKCGSPAPTSNWRCGTCGKWINAGVDYCPHCGHQQNISARVSLDTGSWRKGDDVFAQRFELDDMAVKFKHGVIVEEGQCAILLCNGQVAKVLQPGRYVSADVADFLAGGDRKSLVLVDMGEIPFPIMIPTLRSRDELDLSLGCSVTLRFDPANAERFLANVMSGKAYVYNDKVEDSFVVQYDAIARNLLLKEVEIAARDICNTHQIDELFKNPALRNELEDRIGDQLKRKLDAVGLRLVRVEGVDFHDGAYEEIRKKAGEVEKLRRWLEMELRTDELEKDAKKRKELGENELEDYMARLAHWREMSQLERDMVIAPIREAYKRDRELAEAELKYEMAKKEKTNANELEKLDAEHEAEVKRILHDGELERRRRDHEEQLRQWVAAQNASLEYRNGELKLKEEANRIEEEHERRLAEIKKTQDFLTRISTAKTPAEMHMLIKGHQLEIQKDMGGLEILAMGAANGSTACAEALKGMIAAGNTIPTAALEHENGMLKDFMDRLERMYNAAVQSGNNGRSWPFMR